MTASRRSPVEILWLAARAAIAGRVTHDPVLLLAAADLAGRIEIRTVVVPTLTRGEATAMTARDGLVVDARPDRETLVRDALQWRRAESRLVDEILRRPEPGQTTRPSAQGWRGVVEAGASLSFEAGDASEMLILGDGLAPLAVRAELKGGRRITDETATPSLAYLLWPGQGRGRVTVDNCGAETSGFWVTAGARG